MNRGEHEQTETMPTLWATTGHQQSEICNLHDDNRDVLAMRHTACNTRQQETDVQADTQPEAIPLVESKWFQAKVEQRLAERLARHMNMKDNDNEA